MSDTRFSDEELKTFHDEFKAHCEEERLWRERWMAGFPNADPISHRYYHEAVMRAADAQERFWSELRLDIAKKGLWGLTVIVCGLILAGLATKIGIKP